ncbi:hypothetical protein BU23DRAFT_325784 [Bimuria novae-zelandiae CBS 107.79]|uniref:Uncharacterized protein n=1 Tax=Bimuria novae-zelandiae CBS 107.79 TaxID=1447943 RepID=A0A6A5UPT7_9PLEO|nr:hypothetical protein BU23DRAFT_325784 [Bimuria novae-zelandiae CBS 107.79]
MYKITTFSLNQDQGTPFTVFQVLVAENFKPDRTINGVGLIGELRALGTRSTNHRDNRFILFVLWCLQGQLGISKIRPLDVEVGLSVVDTPDYDTDLQVNPTFKRIYNDVIDYY